MSDATYIVEVSAIQIKPRKILVGSTLRALVSRVASAWQERRKRSTDLTRLYRLNDHVLRDIGLTRAEIGRGAMDSFWRG